jgi:hypothetical protein
MTVESVWITPGMMLFDQRIGTTHQVSAMSRRKGVENPHYRILLHGMKLDVLLYEVSYSNLCNVLKISKLVERLHRPC